jgi:hypothetical protein
MNGTWFAAIAVAAVVLRYVVSCIFWPLTSCRRCRGTGRRYAWFGGAGWRPCGRCEGTGSRFRTGRVVVTRVQSRDGREHAEIRATVRLSAHEPRARWQLARLMTELGRVVRMAAVRKERRQP